MNGPKAGNVLSAVYVASAVLLLACAVLTVYPWHTLRDLC